mmetsp:Transcript_22545/g.49383  ORF Transcript_22545/g.49383 Transcript_22545/m.49383 type:complete len:90 (+) Transcript_22545:1-270(+)
MMHIGRGRDAQLRVEDVSISRAHASITFENNTFVLRDCDSKFGTLVRPYGQENGLVSLTSSQPCTIQCGRSVLKFCVVPTAEAEGVECG